MEQDRGQDCGDSSSQNVQASGSGTSSNSGLPSIEKLDGNTNYATWKFLMELYLLHDDLWEYTSATPSVTDILGRKRDQKARAKICLMIKPHCLVHVRQARTAKQAWDALKNAFEDKGLNNRCRLLGKLVAMKLEHFGTIREYVSSVMATSQELVDLGKEVDDELLAALILQGLTAEFQPMRLAIESSNVTLTTDFVKTKLFQMEDVYKASTSASANPPLSALVSNKSKGKKSQKSAPKKKLKCYICEGAHKALDCPRNPNKKSDALNTFVFATSEKPIEQDWIIDSGASNHMTGSDVWMNGVKGIKRTEITCANGEKIFAESLGSVNMDSHKLTVHDVWYVPGLSNNLLSVSKIVEKGHTVVFKASGCEIFRADECKVKGKAVVKGVVDRGIYKLQCCLQGSALATAGDDQIMLWHRRMGHISMSNLKLLRDKMAKGVSFPNSVNKLECVACIKGKQTKQSFKKSGATRAKEVLGLVHSDVCGPMEVASNSKYRYYLIFIDDFTRRTFVYFLKSKDEVFENFIQFKQFAENQSGKKLKILRTDNGTEFVNNKMDNYLKKCGIQHQLTVDYTPEQNGVAERANRTICEKSRAMLADSGLPKCYWAEAVRHALYLKNRSPTIAVKNMTPEEKWSGKNCDLSNIKIFGCKSFMHIPKQKRRKWDSKSQELTYIGVCDDAKAYRLVDPVTGKIFKARDVVFFENQKHNIPETGQEKRNTEEIIRFSEEESEILEPVELENFEDCEDVPVVEESDIASNAENPAVDSNIVEDNEEVTTVDENTATEDERRYPLRIRQPKQFPDFVLYQAESQQDPTMVQEALSRADSDKWRSAIQEELDALEKNKTWTLVKPPANCNIIDSKWIFCIKEEAGNKRRYKARLVARGFSQRYGIDYDETFSPVVRHSSLRVLLALAANINLNIDHMDVKTAFLNGDLSEKVYMKQPAGFEVKGKEDYVCFLKRSLYGLKQAPREWNKKLNKELLQLGFKRSKNEPCVYIRSKASKIIILAVYVDDMLLFWNDLEDLRKIKKELMSKFEMKDLGKAELILGMRITQTESAIKLDQEKYIDKVLKNFGMDDCKVASTPSVTGQKLEKPGPEHKPDGKIPYQNLIGSLMYLAVCTRPDIAYAVNHLSQFNNCYTEEHFTAAKRVLRYLKGTKRLGLNYTKEKKMANLDGYADASHASCYDRRSFTGIVFLWQKGAVSWESRKQRTIALSTAEAEYVAMSEAAREAIFLKRFISEVTSKPEMPLKLYSDSQSAVAIAQNPVHHQRTKHIDVRHHFVREAVEDGHIKLEYMETLRMVADVLTKPLLKGKFEWCVRGMGLNE